MQEKMEKSSNFFERIEKIIEYYGIKSTNIFAKKYLGYASSEKINRLKKENTSPSFEILKDISNKFEEISPEWLLTGKGAMLKTASKNDNQLIVVGNNSFQGNGNKIQQGITGELEALRNTLLQEKEERIKELLRDKRENAETIKDLRDTIKDLREVINGLKKQLNNINSNN
jgi:predicted house-cleaning noncanonical NTP pyrophosphatase (MazG superfamily)